MSLIVELKQKKIDIIIVDECHHCKAQSYSNVLTNMMPLFDLDSLPHRRNGKMMKVDI